MKKRCETIVIQAPKPRIPVVRGCRAATLGDRRTKRLRTRSARRQYALSEG